MSRILPVLFVVLGFASAAFAQNAQQQFLPVPLDLAKANELIDDVPMTSATRAAIIKLVNRWETETVAAKAAQSPSAGPPVPPAPDKPEPPK